MKKMNNFAVIKRKMAFIPSRKMRASFASYWGNFDENLLSTFYKIKINVSVSVR